jgi:hypothetical protein
VEQERPETRLAARGRKHETAAEAFFMKRRPYGVNLDDGVELSSAEDFDRLYVSARPEEESLLHEWMTAPRSEALILSGQIGSGKTTLLNGLLRRVSHLGIMRVDFDQVPLEETQGAFTAVLFASLLKKALALGCSCDGLGIALSDFGECITGRWEALRDLLLLVPPSIARTRRVRAAYNLFDENPRQGLRACAALIDRIKKKISMMLSIIAEGVDKFAISRPGYIALAETLEFLSDYKTLYEANAIHFFDTGRKWVASEKLFIGPLSNETIVSMYERRLGSYAPLYRDSFPLLVQYAGGNARQALRLLNGYYFRRMQRGNNWDAAIALAAHRVTQDLLQFGFDRFPADTLAIFKRDGYVEAAVLTRPETAQDARDILYHNWAFLRSTPAAGTTRWPLFINPLVSDAVAWEKSIPEPPELTAVKRWAKEHHISPMGLSIPKDEQERLLGWKEIWEQLSSSESPKDELNIVRLLEEVASSLFSANRQDRIMVSYRDPQNLNIAIDYLIGKAATYGPFLCREIRLTGGGDADPVASLMAKIKRKDNSTIFAVFMEGDWTPDQVHALERLRDRFINVQMLWFVEHAALLRYLPHWPQFRQLLRFYVLEDDFLAALSKEELDEDLSVLSNVSGLEDSGIGRLRGVLQYLERREEKA